MKQLAFIAGSENPMSGYYMSALLKIACVPTCVVVDTGSKWSEKDLAIHAHRTAGRLPALSVEQISGPFDMVFVENHNSEGTIEELTRRQCAIVVNGGTPRILKPQFLDSVEGVLNCHPGILPRYRGCSCVEWAVFNDDPVGNTVHLMTAGIDEGPIVRSEAIALSHDDDYPATRVKVFRHGFDLMADAAAQMTNGTIDPASLPAQGDGIYWKPIDADKMDIVVQKLASGTYRFQS